MEKKQNILCLCHFIINMFLTHVTHMRVVRNECCACAEVPREKEMRNKQ